MLAVTAGLSGCAVVSAREDGPRAWGLAVQRDVALQRGTCRRITSPGFALRVLPGLWGISIGWHELLSFHAGAPSDAPAAVAFLHRIYGVDLGARGLVMGAAHEFLVPHPSGAHVVQSIRFSERRLAESVVWRREVD